MKYLAYRAQLKQEYEFLQRQREESAALDNYTNVDMEIDDDDTTPTGECGHKKDRPRGCLLEGRVCGVINWRTLLTCFFIVGSAPLPLIETLEMKPPLPPSGECISSSYLFYVLFNYLCCV